MDVLQELPARADREPPASICAVPPEHAPNFHCADMLHFIYGASMHYMQSRAQALVAFRADPQMAAILVRLSPVRSDPLAPITLSFKAECVQFKTQNGTVLVGDCRIPSRSESPCQLLGLSPPKACLTP